MTHRDYSPADRSEDEKRVGCPACNGGVVVSGPGFQNRCRVCGGGGSVPLSVYRALTEPRPELQAA